MSHLRFSVIALVGAASVACSTTAAPEASSVVEPLYSAPVCPADSAGWYQAQATRVAGYLLGGPDPFVEPEHDAVACAGARTCLGNLRSAIEDGRLSASGGGEKSLACGLPVATFTLTATSALSDYDFDDAARCAAELDGCWGAGVSGFFLPERAVEERKISIDPSPVRLLGALSGVMGSTAPGVYESNGMATTVYEWPAAWVASSIPAGAPCASTALGAGAFVTKTIQALGPSRRCL